MLAEFGIIPDVFDRGSYSSPELGEVCLAQLLEVCREEAVVRDFCNGRWSEVLAQPAERWHTATKEVIEILYKERRLHRTAQYLPKMPEDDAEWYYEASASNEKMPLDMILAGSPASLGCADDPAVTPITKLNRSVWWQNRSFSMQVERQTSEYLKFLRPILRRASSFMFVDPHIDEEKPNYAEFCHLIRELGRPGTRPRIEIHIWQGKELSSIADLMKRLQNCNRELVKSRIEASVYSWPINFHDRYLITDLVGLQLPYGFDIATNNVKETTWGRLGRRDREAIELRFAPNVGRYGIPKSFTIGTAAA